MTNSPLDFKTLSQQTLSSFYHTNLIFNGHQGIPKITPVCDSYRNQPWCFCKNFYNVYVYLSKKKLRPSPHQPLPSLTALIIWTGKKRAIRMVHIFYRGFKEFNRIFIENILIGFYRKLMSKYQPDQLQCLHLKIKPVVFELKITELSR